MQGKLAILIGPIEIRLKAAAPREAKRNAKHRRLPHHDLMAYDWQIAGHPGNVG
jgi:hypothetical protein